MNYVKTTSLFIMLFIISAHLSASSSEELLGSSIQSMKQGNGLSAYRCNEYYPLLNTATNEAKPKSFMKAHIDDSLSTASGITKQERRKIIAKWMYDVAIVTSNPEVKEALATHTTILTQALAEKQRNLPRFIKTHAGNFAQARTVMDSAGL